MWVSVGTGGEERVVAKSASNFGIIPLPHSGGEGGIDGKENRAMVQLSCLVWWNNIEGKRKVGRDKEGDSDGIGGPRQIRKSKRRRLPN